MENMEHALIDMEKLADSLSEKMKTLHYPSSEECCIYRVPQSKRCLHPSHYTPPMLSIGPLHHTNPELQAMEVHKLRYLHHFLRRTKVSMAHFLAFIKEREAKLRNCYAETIHLESDEFVTMILVDSVFIIELFLRDYDPNFRTDDDRIFGKSGLSLLGIEMNDDLYLLENQLPLFILNELFDLAKTETYRDIYEEISFKTITHAWFSSDPILPIDHMKIETHFSKAQHFLDLLVLCLQPSPQPREDGEVAKQNIPGIKELHEAGVRFESRSRENLLDITFSNGILGIPFFKEYYLTERLYRNLITFEIMHGYPRYFNDYVVIMSYLLRNPKDADLLIQSGIIGGTSSERLSTTLQSVSKNSLVGHSFSYGHVAKDLRAYCKSPWHSWKANLKQNYFNTPWASISVIAAVILILLTVTQTICSIIAL
ncbi:DUF862 domain-containing protein [Citrus sinensis]|uniref:Uncharacterized protein n=3 Tax=Citrus TaxID=2706 RepID=V4U097_CITCL|nr:UPF0481 protein At3g47200 [Citrus x clementina]XP_006446053.1 UPF0481 protein At3g47200 [Citrus x clementina]XP_006467200.1 UPF0481 protein At3g47200 [Citrus sinensis]XP_006467201.1 UPF0481 protein At3g47200 [Citrus sinensis]GAY47221.1 hypothetical protein CUMW_102930 [Citrus unshiu]ESR59292.1 hypothetical protein CICLE_v10015337mg [Citrus x clementina]ESR59293.1 hypothetical protein CICLE_v10015337mg [Citrus x clementina]KAH9741168.1 DUF862 domain-containing protein [Citrus sinensis]KAH